MQARPLAAWSLGVSEQEIDSMITQGKTYSVPLPEIIPVALVYFTRFLDEHGQVVSHPDIYNNRQAEPGTNLEAAARRLPSAALDSRGRLSLIENQSVRD